MKSAYNIRSIITYLQIATLFALIASMAFRTSVLTRWIMITAGVFFVLDCIVNKRWQGWYWTHDKWLYVAMIALYLFTFIWHIGETNSTRFLSVLEERLPLFVCGIIGLLGLNKYIYLHQVGYVFIATSILSSLFIIFQSKGFDFFQLTWGYQSLHFATTRIKFVNSHMVYNMYLNMSLIFISYLLSKSNIQLVIKIIIALFGIWIFYILCLTEGRVGFITSLCIITLGTLNWIRKYCWKGAIPIVILYSIIFIWVISQKNRLEFNTIENDMRWTIWQAGWNTVKESPIFGKGVCGGRQSFINNVYKNEDLTTWWKPYIDGKLKGNPNGIHPHNTYLEIWMEFGFIGLCLLLFILLFPLTMCPSKHRIFVLMVIVCFVLQCMFDKFLSPLIYCLVILFFTSQSAISEENVVQKHDKE